MNSTNRTIITSANTNINADKSLKLAASLWVVVATFGLWFFGYYILVVYGLSAITGNIEAWNEELIYGIIEGDPLGNIAVALHLFLASIIVLGGPLQLIPKIQTHAPAFHRWNGRVYIFTAILISIGGIFMVWTRGVIGGLFSIIAISINAILIIIFAIMTWRAAVARQMSKHRLWALRTFMVVNGVWFFRIGFGLWIFINGGAPGSTENLDGPFDRFLAYADFLLPLAFFEFYLLAKKQFSAVGKFATATLLLILSIATGIGIFMAAQIFWLPSLPQ